MKRFLTLILMLTALAAFPAGAQSISSQKERKARLDREILMLEQQIRENSSKSSNALSRLSLLRQREDARRALIRESDAEIMVMNDSIRTLRKEMAAIQSRLDTMTCYYDRLVKNAYKNRDSRIWYMYILASENIGQAAKRFAYLKSLSSQMNAQAKKIKEARAELEVKLTRFNRLKAEAEKLRTARQNELAKLQKEESQSKQLVAQLGREKSKYQKQLASKKKQVEALNKEIERLIAESMGDGSGKSGKPAKEAKAIDYTLAKEFQANKGKLPWPAEGPVAEHFGRNPHPVYKKITMPFNNGINISVSRETEAKAVFSGEVKRVIVMPGYSKCVLVQHGDYFTFYCKLSSVSVKAGDKLKTGQTVGIVDTIDGQTQLHFQLWKGTAPQNPELWLRPRD